MRNKLVAGVDLEGRTLLDVGCGTGRIALWAAERGARRVVGREPEVDGSNAGMQDSFRRTVREVGLEDRVELVTARLQDYDAGNRALRRRAARGVDQPPRRGRVRAPHEDEQARQTYREHLRLLADVAAPGAILLATDCDRRNLFQRLGVRNPLSPEIEWEKHQSPDLWARLLADVGFEAPTVEWMTLNTLRGPGQALLANRACLPDHQRVPAHDAAQQRHAELSQPRAPRAVTARTRARTTAARARTSLGDTSRAARALRRGRPCHRSCQRPTR